MINVIVPMAGEGKRFTDAGFNTPKPLIDIKGKPMFRRALESIRTDETLTYTFVIRKNHIYASDLKKHVSDLTYQIIELDHETEGAADTILQAAATIEDNDSPLMVINSDNILDIEPVSLLKLQHRDGLVYVFKDSSGSTNWSYVKVNNDGFVTQVAEKKPISDIATAGLYVWKSVRLFKKAARQMIEKDIRVNGEYYLAPVYNENVANDDKIGIEYVKSMYGVGTPKELYGYLNMYG